jgi:hypothetical protein
MDPVVTKTLQLVVHMVTTGLYMVKLKKFRSVGRNSFGLMKFVIYADVTP